MDEKEIVSMLRKLIDSSESVRGDIHRMDKKLDLHIQKTEFELAKINQLDAQQNLLLDQHIEGVNTLKKWCDQHEAANQERFKELEKPRIWWAYTLKITSAVGVIAGAAYYVLRVIMKI